MKKEIARDMRIPIVIGITGHRDIRNEDKKIIEDKITEIIEETRSLCPDSPIVLLSPLAEGADRIAALTAIKKGIKVIAPLPMPINEYRKDFITPACLSEFDDLLKQTVHFELSSTKLNSSKGIPEQKLKRSQQYAQVGAYVAMHSHILIAIWDGVVSTKLAGTSATVQYKLEGIPEPYAPAKQHLDAVENGPVYHILSPRASNPQPDGEHFSILKLYPPMEDSDELPMETFQRILIKIDHHNKDIATHAEKLTNEIHKNRHYVMPEANMSNLSPTGRIILDQYAIADTLAGLYQKQSKRSLISLFILVIVAIFIFQIYLEFFKHPLLLFLYPSTLGIAFLLYYWAIRRDLQNKYLDYRAIAEGLRVQFFWDLAGLQENVTDHYLRKQKSELNWIKYAIRTYVIGATGMGQQPNSDAIEPELFRQNLILTHWVEDQQSYYARAARREKKKLHRQEKISKILYCTGLGLAIIMLIFHKEYLSIALLQHIVIVSIVMSIATAAVFQGHAEKEAYAEHLRQYARMRELFARAKRKLAFFIDKKDVVSAKHIISDLGKEALAENGDWVLLHRARPIEVPKG